MIRPMAELAPNEREATDQPPAVRIPLTARQIWGLVLPGTLFLLLIGILLWGTLSSIRPGGAALPATPTGPPAAATSPAPPPSVTSVALAPPPSPTPPA